MKKHSKTPLILFSIFFIVISALAISGIFSKQQQAIQSKGHLIKPDPSPIRFSTSLDNSYYYDNNSVYLFVNLVSDKTEGNRERSPLNVSIVIDKSGSMADRNKLDYVKKAVDYIIDELGRDDYVSVIAYDDYVDVVQRS